MYWLWPWCLTCTRGMNFFLDHILCIIWDFFCILCTIPCTLDSLWERRPFSDLQKFHFSLKIHNNLHLKKKIWSIYRASNISGKCLPLMLRFKKRSLPCVPTSISVHKSWFLILNGLEFPNVFMCILKTVFQTADAKVSEASRDYYSFKTWERGYGGKDG